MSKLKSQKITADLSDKFFDQYVRQTAEQEEGVFAALGVNAPERVPAGKGHQHRAHPKKKAKRQMAKQSRKRNR